MHNFKSINGYGLIGLSHIIDIGVESRTISEHKN